MSEAFIVSAEPIFARFIEERLLAKEIRVSYSNYSPHHVDNVEKVIAEIKEKKPQAILIHLPNLELENSVIASSRIAQQFKGQIPVLVFDNLPYNHPGFLTLNKAGATILFNEYSTDAIVSSVLDTMTEQKPAAASIPTDASDLPLITEIKSDKDDRFSLILRAKESSLSTGSGGKQQKLFCFDYLVFLKPKNADALQDFLKANNVESAVDSLHNDGSILITGIRGIAEVSMLSIPPLVKYLQETCGWMIGNDVGITIQKAIDIHCAGDDRIFEPLEKIAARKPAEVVKLTPNNEPLTPEMRQIHEMILNVLSPHTIAHICYNDEAQMAYVMQTGNPLMSNGIEAKHITAKILAKPKVKALLDKIEAKYPITLNEFRELLDDVNDVSHYIGWVLRDGAKSTVEPLFQGKLPTVGVQPTTTHPEKTASQEKSVPTATIRTPNDGTQVIAVSPTIVKTTETTTVRDPAHERDVVNGVLNQLSWKISIERGAKLAKAEITTRDISKLNQNIKYGAGVGVATRPLSAKWRYEISFPERSFPILRAKGVELIERTSPKFG